MKETKYLEIREAITAIDDGSEVKKISGKIPYNVRSYDLGGFVEVINPTAFNKTLTDGADVRLLYNHDTSKVLARVKNGSLTLRNTEDGLEFDAVLNNTSFANDAYENIKSKNVDTLSFGFNVIQDSWTKEGDQQIRTLNEVKLVEISAVVAFPAYPQTVSEARGINVEKLEAILSKKELASDDYLEIDTTIRELKKILPNNEGENKEAIVNQADEESLETKNNTYEFLRELLDELKK